MHHKQQPAGPVITDDGVTGLVVAARFNEPKERVEEHGCCLLKVYPVMADRIVRGLSSILSMAKQSDGLMFTKIEGRPDLSLAGMTSMGLRRNPTLAVKQPRQAC